jgi:predicted dehydrogenase
MTIVAGNREKHEEGSVRDVRVAVIGAGGIAARHIGNLLAVPGAQLVGVADLELERATAEAARGGAQPFQDWRRMLDDVRPDALLICVPPFGHGEPELGAIERGIPFFVEKPLAADLATAERIADAVAAAGLVTAVGYHWRYLSTVERARELLADNPAQLAMGYWLDGVPPRAWWVQHSQSGGQLVEQATHILDIARYLVGEIDSIGAVGVRTARKQPHGGDVADAYVATAVFESGAIGTFSSTSLTRWPHRIGLHLVSEAMVLELTEFEIMIDVGRGRPVEAASGDPFLAELTDFLTAASGGPNNVRVPYAEALKTHRVAVTATESAEHGGALQRVDVGS